MKNSYFIVVIFCLMLVLIPFQQISLADESQEMSENSTRIFTIPEHDFYPENIAYDPVSKSYFLGSMSQSRIIRIHEDGRYEDFVNSSESGLLSSVGMKVDSKRRFLWVCSGKFSLFANYESSPAKTGILKFNIDSGKLVKKWILDEAQTTPYHIFNDLVLASNGEVYATTTLLGRIYTISADDKLELLVQLNTGSHNNGITLDKDEKNLFLTIDRSLFKMDLASRQLVELKASEPGLLQMTDGLYYYKNSLIAVKPRLKQVIQLFLDDDLTSVVKAEILVQNHPDFAYPTTGVIVDDKLVLVATSYANVPRNNESPKQHPDVFIHEVPLKEK